MHMITIFFRSQILFNEIYAFLFICRYTFLSGTLNVITSCHVYGWCGVVPGFSNSIKKGMLLEKKQHHTGCNSLPITQQ